MKSPSEIAREILSIWNPGYDPLTPSDNIMLFDRITKALTAERQRQERLAEALHTISNLSHRNTCDVCCGRLDDAKSIAQQVLKEVK